MADVFLSYAREDSARAAQIAHGLEQAGLDVFWDNEIPPGATWADHIEQKLTQCKVLIVLWSEHSTKSQWVREEARMGRDKGVLIPVMIDTATPPFGFGEVQAANLATWSGDASDANWRRFVEAVTRFAQGEARAPQPQMSAPPRATAPQPAASPAASWKAPVAEEKKIRVPVWAWVAGGVGGIVLLLIAAAALMPNPPTQVAGQQTTPVQPAVGPAPAAAADSPQAIIMAQLQQAHAALGQQGFQIVGQPYSGGLQQGQTWNVPAQLYPGYDYRVVGVCDRDCADLDLVVFDASGTPFVQDTSTTSQPVVGIQTPYPGNFTIQVQMYNCTVAPCYYAIALWARPTQ